MGGLGTVVERWTGFGEDAPLNLPDLDRRTSAEVVARMLSPDFDAWSTAAANVGHCAKPIRLHGHSATVDTTTGEVLSTYRTSSEPLGVLHVRCGNRRAAACPSCSRTYAADTFHLIRAGVVGGKGVPETVVENPLVFATLTAPSFGPVHGTRGGKRCRPYRTKDQSSSCVHGRPTGCHRVHGDDDPLVGQPICWECYDYLGQITWQWWAPELWRRYTIALRRAVADRLGVNDTRLFTRATVQYAKVGEYQRRGIIHFHGLIRLDGPRTDDGFAPAPDSIDAAALAALVRETASKVWFTAPPLFAGDDPRLLHFGTQVDTRPVRATERPDDPDTALNAEQVAGYLAKYATKSATDTYPDSPSNRHLMRLRTILTEVAAQVVADAHADGIVDIDAVKALDYGLLGKWVHMLGFRGHFSSKSRRYSVTLGQLRRARTRYQRFHAAAARDRRRVDPADLDRLLADDDTETTLVIGEWAFAGSGWETDGDAELAKAAAARAREYAQHRARVKAQVTNTAGR